MKIHSVLSMCKKTSNKQFYQILHASGGHLCSICMRLGAKRLRKFMCGRQSHAKFACTGRDNSEIRQYYVMKLE